MKTIRYSALNHPGRKRLHNQDALLLPGMVPGPQISDPACEPLLFQSELPLDEMKLLGVFDGLGGLEKGEETSRIAAETALTCSKNQEAFEWLKNYFQKAERAIASYRNQQQVAACGTTAVLLLAKEDHVHLAWIGDSRIYLYQDRKLRQISQDHVGFAPWGIKPPMIQYLGLPETEGRIEPEYTVLQTRPGDIYLLCSDGLSDMLSLEEMELILQNEDPDQAGKQMMDLALAKGGKDNITLILAEIRERRSSLISRLFSNRKKVCQ